MALFGTKKETKADSSAKKVAVLKKESGASKATRTVAHVLKAPRVTEKATFSADKNVYVFDIDTNASKIDVALAIEAAYNVKPVKIATVKVPSKKVFYRGKKGVAKAGKKAYVYLDKNDKIEII